MAFDLWWGTGFGPGTHEMFSLYNASRVAAITTSPKTGTYHLRIQSDGYANVSVVNQSSDYVDVGLYVRTHSGMLNIFKIYVYTTDGEQLYLVFNSSYSWDAYVDGALVASGTSVVANNAYHNFQFRVYINNSGYIQTKVDGVADIDYSGDTQVASASTIDYIKFELAGANQYVYLDDISIGEGGWPGDIRYDVSVPDGDDSVQWTPSAGDNYAAVGEIPYSDTHVSTGSVNYKDKYTLGDWSGSEKTPYFLVAWVRAWKDNADSRSLAIGIDSGGTEDSSGSRALTTSAAYYSHVVSTDPSTGSAWEDSGIDAAKLFIENF